jgi:hypothetical protein
VGLENGGRVNVPPNSLAALGGVDHDAAWIVLGSLEDSGLGLTDNEMVYLHSVVAGYVQGAARNAVDQAHTEQATGVTDEQWWSTYGRLLSEYTAGAGRYPTLTSLSSSAWAFDGGTEADFEFGLRRVLDGARRSSGNVPPDPVSSRQSGVRKPQSLSRIQVLRRGQRRNAHETQKCQSLVPRPCRTPARLV